MRGMILRKTRRSLTQSALVTMRDEVLHPSDRVFWNVTDQEFRYTNGSRIVVGGLDDPAKVMSTQSDLAYVQEATDLSDDDWEKVTTRLRKRQDAVPATPG